MKPTSKFKQRLIWLGLFLALLAIEILIALFVHDRFVRPYLGDVLVVALVYCLARTIHPAGCRLLPLWVFLFAAAVEGSQAFHLAARLGLAAVPVIGTILGATFDWLDLVCYAAGCLFLAGLEWLAKLRRNCLA